MGWAGFWGLPMNLALLSLCLFFFPSLYYPWISFTLSPSFFFSSPFSSPKPFLEAYLCSLTSSYHLMLLVASGVGCSITGPEQMSSCHDKDSRVDEREWGGCLHHGFSSLHTYFSQPFHLLIMRLTLELLFYPTFSRALVFPLLFLSLCGFLLFPWASPSSLFCAHS